MIVQHKADRTSQHNLIETLQCYVILPTIVWNCMVLETTVLCCTALCIG